MFHTSLSSCLCSEFHLLFVDLHHHLLSQNSLECPLCQTGKELRHNPSFPGTLSTGQECSGVFCLKVPAITEEGVVQCIIQQPYCKLNQCTHSPEEHINKKQSCIPLPIFVHSSAERGHHGEMHVTPLHSSAYSWLLRLEESLFRTLELHCPIW